MERAKLDMEWRFGEYVKSLREFEVSNGLTATSVALIALAPRGLIDRRRPHARQPGTIPAGCLAQSLVVPAPRLTVCSKALTFLCGVAVARRR